MSGAPKSPPPRGPSPGMRDLQEKYGGVLNQCMELHARNAELLEENLKLNKTLATFHVDLEECHKKLRDAGLSDMPALQGGTRNHHRRHRRKRTRRVPRK
jgi:hypothetical protein